MSTIGTSVNLRDPATFNIKKITRDQGEERLKILNTAKQVLKNNDEQLTPRSSRELSALAEAFEQEADDDALSKVKIKRDVGEFYTVMFQQSEGEKMFNRYCGVQQKLVTLPQTVYSGGGRGILQAMVDPNQQNKFYQLATQSQRDAIMGSDFFNSLKDASLANLSLLSCLPPLKHHRVFNQIVSLYQSSSLLYDKQIAFNRACESRLLEHSRVCKRSQELMESLINECGRDFKHIPEDFSTRASNIVRNELELTEKEYGKISEEYKNFLKELVDIQVGIENCIGVVSGAKEDAVKILSKLESLGRGREQLDEKVLSLEKRYQAFQKARSQEDSSVRTRERTHFSFFFIKFGTTEYVKSDFGSDQLFQEYQQAKQHKNQLETEMNQLQNDLRSQLEKSMPGCSCEDAQTAAGHLSSALLAVTNFKGKIEARKIQAETQRKTVQDQLSKISEGSEGITSLDQATDYMESMFDRITALHSFWGQSRIQCLAISKVKNMESGHQEAIRQFIANPTGDLRQAIQDLDKILCLQTSGQSGERGSAIERLTLQDVARLEA